MIDARIGLGYRSRADFCRATDYRLDWPSISLRHLGTLERGGEVGRNTLAKLEVIFRWTPGTIERILAGGGIEEPRSAQAPEVEAAPAVPSKPWRSYIREGIEVGDLIYRLDNAQDIADGDKRRIRELILGPDQEAYLVIRNTA